jgi:hypothetical protein
MNFTFCAFNLDITDQDLALMLEQIKKVPEKLWYYDNFRGCYMLPLYNSGNIKNNTSNGILDYTVAINFCPEVKNILENKIFPFMEPNGRVTILKTMPGHKLNVHLDSTVEEIGTLQHKFRVVLDGEIDKLYFLDKNLHKVYMPRFYNTYILDGSHPHGLDASTEEKITLCIGAPWRGQATEKYNKLLENSSYSCKISRPTINKDWTK